MKNSRFFILFSILVSLISLAGCQSQTTERQSQVPKTLSYENIEPQQTYTFVTQNPWEQIKKQTLIDIPDNQRIKKERDNILKHSYTFEKNLSQSEPYIYYIVDKLNQYHMPIELAIIPLIESAYNPLAKSRAKATGLWQITPITAKEYGLTANKWYDPRQDLIKSTDAAIKLLQYLNQRFDGDWLLTLAAYNAGEGRVKRAIAKNKLRGLPTNYWALNLSTESQRYIPKFLAIADIIRHHEKYEVTLPTLNQFNALVKIDLTANMKLMDIAQYTEIPLSKLSAFNACYSKKEVKGAYHIFVPAAYAPELYEKLQASSLVKEDITDLLQHHHDILDHLNPLYDPQRTNHKYLAISDKEIKRYEQEHKRFNQIIYQIKAGDNLSSIAKNYSIKVNELIKWNNIKNVNYLKPGDKLTINIKKM